MVFAVGRMEAVLRQRFVCLRSGRISHFCSSARSTTAAILQEKVPVTTVRCMLCMPCHCLRNQEGLANCDCLQRHLFCRWLLVEVGKPFLSFGPDSRFC